MKVILPMLAVLAAGMCGCAASQDEGRPVSDADNTYAAATRERGALICTLASRDAVVRVCATDVGTRYTLCSIDGAVVAADLDAAALARLRPEMDPRGMQADEGMRVMMVDRAE